MKEALSEYCSHMFDLLERCEPFIGNTTPQRKKTKSDLARFFSRFKKYRNSLAGSGKYKCEVEYTCVRLNCMRSLIEAHLKEKPDVQQALLNYTESIRADNNKLRAWGFDLRLKLIEKESKNT